MSDFKKIQAVKAAFEDVPGTYLFNSDRCKAGYHLNMFCMSLIQQDSRDEFLADEEAFLKKYPMSEAQRKSVMDRDWLAMIQLGGNIYHTAKLAATDERPFRYIAGEMTGMGQTTYQQMMIDGGRPVVGNRSKSEQKGQ